MTETLAARLTEGEPATARLSITGLGKTFGAHQALADIDLRIMPGEIHGLIGRNGAGKSTLIKVLSGFHSPDLGAVIEVDGQRAFRGTAGRLRESRLAFVHQDLALIPSLTVLENLAVGRYRTSTARRVHWRAERASAIRILRLVGLDVEVTTLVADLDAVERSLVAIARCLSDVAEEGKGVLVLDEPTASLPHDSVDRLFRAVRAAADRGTAVVFVSHRLEEVMALTDRTTVLRDGRLVDTWRTSDLDEDTMLQAMLGEPKAQRSLERTVRSDAEMVLAVDDLAAHGLAGIHLSLRPGEILGVTGINGSGYDRIPHLLFGAERARAGTLTIKGVSTPLRRMTPRRAIRCGLGLLPADRQSESGVGELSVAENLSLMMLRRFTKFGFLDGRQEEREACRLTQSYGVVPENPRARLDQLSGGNQQKALLAKWLEVRPDVLLLQEPCHGIDVSAKRDIHLRLSKLAATGSAVLVASAEYDDLASLCDRVVVLREGHVVADLTGNDLTLANIVRHSYLSPSP